MNSKGWLFIVLFVIAVGCIIGAQFIDESDTEESEQNIIISDKIDGEVSDNTFSNSDKPVSEDKISNISDNSDKNISSTFSNDEPYIDKSFEIDDTCGICGGNGREKCVCCSGLGEVSCSHCLGGYEFCTACHGMGTISAPYFGGEHIPDRQCSICGGSGQKRCIYCNGTGMEKCRDCYGRGDMTCTGCNGRGRL